MSARRLILASASPRRQEILARAGFEFSVEPAGIDETPLPGEAAAAYVQRLAIEKAEAVLAQHGTEEVRVLAADTAVVLADGTILGKPLGEADAARMLELLSGRTHAVMTGLAACGGGRTVSGIEITQVMVNVISEAEIAGYIEGGEPLDKAGAYAIQGYAARWIPRIEGDYFNVVGLPVARTVALLTQLEAPEAEE